MELLTPEIGLLVWSGLAFLNMILCIAAIFLLVKNKTIDPRKKLIWLLAIIFLPFVGVSIFLGFRKRVQPGVA